MPATTVSASELPPRRLKLQRFQHAASPTANRLARAGDSPAVVGADAAHRVVLGRPHRDPVARQVDAEEVAADVLHLAQLVVDMAAPSTAMSSHRRSPAADLTPLAAAHVLGHAARDHVTRGQLGLLRLV